MGDKDSMGIIERIKAMQEIDEGRKEKEKSMILFERIQINESSPAIAQLKITVGEKIENPQEVLKQIKEYCDNFIEKTSPSVEKDIILRPGKLIIEARETFQMYSFLKKLEEELKHAIKRYNVTSHGFWKAFV